MHVDIVLVMFVGCQQKIFLSNKNQSKITFHSIRIQLYNDECTYLRHRSMYMSPHHLHMHHYGSKAGNHIH